MKSLVLSAVSALVLSSTVLPAVISPAQAQMRFNFSAPFITDSGLANAIGDTHFIDVAVTGYPLTDLIVQLPNDMRVLKGAKVTDSMGKEIPANVTASTGSIKISFSQPIVPSNMLKVTLSGVRMDSTGETVIYRVYAVKEGLRGELPLGTAMVRLPDRG